MEREYNCPFHKLLLNFEVEYIYTFLELKEVLTACRVSKLFHKFLNDEMFWEGRVKRHLKIDKLPEGSSSFRELYKRRYLNFKKGFDNDYRKSFYGHGYENSNSQLVFDIETRVCKFEYSFNCLNPNGRLRGDVEATGNFQFFPTKGEFGGIIIKDWNIDHREGDLLQCSSEESQVKVFKRVWELEFQGEDFQLLVLTKGGARWAIIKTNQKFEK